jgi:AcrR family transcriptional regulator
MLKNENIPPAVPLTAEFMKVLTAAGELFLKYGIRNVSMADIAKHLGISKKTLYTHITNKDDLIYQFTLLHLQAEQQKSNDIISTAKNALDELIQITLQAQQNMQAINPCLIFELSKYHRQAWQIIEQFRQDFIYNNVRRNLEQGIAEGLYRADLNAAIISKIYVYSLPIFTSAAQLGLQEYSLVALHTEFVKYHIHGILSPKGARLFDNYAFN